MCRTRASSTRSDWHRSHCQASSGHTHSPVPKQSAPESIDSCQFELVLGHVVSRSFEAEEQGTLHVCSHPAVVSFELPAERAGWQQTTLVVWFADAPISAWGAVEVCCGVILRMWCVVGVKR